MGITETNIEDFVNEVVKKHWTTKEGLAARNKKGRTQANIVSARAEIIKYLINKGFYQNEISTYLNLTPTIVCLTLKKLRNKKHV